MRAVVVVIIAVLGSSSSYADPIDTLSSTPLAERGLALGTALTVPAGDVELSGRSIFVAADADVAIGLGRGTELWVEGAIGTAADHSYALGLKQVIAHRHSWQLALEGAVRRITEYDSNPYDPVGTLSFGPVTSGRADAFALSAIASACAADCRALFTGGVTAAIMPGADESAALFYGWLDASYGSGHVRGIFELAAFPVFEGHVVGTAGARFTWRHVAFEVGLGWIDQAPSPILAPVIGVAYRP
ncbi:MAG TPA: hypothetical protein VGG28_12830 [Kofleriaceae bacterium]|jgi:hypothetical protein